MKRGLLILFALLTAATARVAAQAVFETEIPLRDGELWWGGAVGYGALMPYGPPSKEYDLAKNSANNQVVPLLLSNRGRYIWSDKPFVFEVRETSIVVRSHYGIMEPVSAGRTLRETYLAACQAHFPPTGNIPEELFFTVPQYNTWIELGHDQSQSGVMEYAGGILAAGLPAGVLMIDDGWQTHFGSFAFRHDKFADPKAMVDMLHAMGFRVMLWVCPFVSPDSGDYRDLAARGFLLRAKGGKRPAIIDWWNGQSACYDMTNPDARAWFVDRLRDMQQRYGVDGFKFDGGDPVFYDPERVEGYVKGATSTDHTQAWAEVALQFPFNELRACWKMGGQPLVQRLGDKDASWEHLSRIVPEMTAAGLMGYAYTCPDMVGGGQIASFKGKDPSSIDQKLIVRSAQVHAMMPMMQFSVAPWRVLSGQNMSLVRAAAQLHARMAPYIIECARNSARTGEPIVRPMEYAFPDEGFANCRDQYMLGERYMVAPVTGPEDHRDIKLPRGRWRDDQGKTWGGNTSVSVEVPAGRILYFEKL